jgi:hypothetical protein
VENILKSIYKITTAASVKIAVCFLVAGIVALTLSYIAISQVLAFIGLGLTFWGALFLLITPVRYVEGSFMVNTIKSTYSNTDRILKDLKYKGKGYHIPPYPTGVYIPEHLKGLEEMVVFISKDQEGNTTPSIEQMAQNKFLVDDPKGLLQTPPGLGLLNQIEKKSRADFTKTALNDLCEIMPRYILDNYSLAKEIDMTLKENEIDIQINDSIYKNLYTQEKANKSILILGCPIISSIACAIAKASGKPVVIQKIKFSEDRLNIAATYQIM